MNIYIFLNIVVIVNCVIFCFIIVVFNCLVVFVWFFYFYGVSVCVGVELVFWWWLGVREVGLDIWCDVVCYGVGMREGEIFGIENGMVEMVVGNEVVGIVVDSVGWGSLV